MSCCRKEISDMTGNKDENVKGVAGEGSKPVKELEMWIRRLLLTLASHLYENTWLSNQWSNFMIESKSRWAVVVVGMFRRQQMCSTNRVMLQETPVDRFKNQPHYSWTWTFQCFSWGKQASTVVQFGSQASQEQARNLRGELNSQHSHVLSLRKDHPFFCSWRVFGVEGNCSLWPWWG